MRRIYDEAGAEWDVVLGHASWGVFEAMFVPVHGGSEDIRVAPLPDESQAAASRTLMDLDRDELLSLLSSAKPRAQSD